VRGYGVGRKEIRGTARYITMSPTSDLPITTVFD
jgi:hypothetical protein